MPKETSYFSKAASLFWIASMLSIFIFAGCTTKKTTFNAEMCDKIAADPTAVLPRECMPYKEKDAEKAFNKTKKTLKSKEDLEVNKEK